MDINLIGEQMKAKRKKLNWTLEQLSERIGVSHNYMGHIERGTRIPSVPILLKMASELDVSLDYLFGDQTPSSYSHYIDKMISKMKNLNEAQQKQLYDVFESAMQIISSEKK